MRTTPGITSVNMSRLPLATEGEMTPGDPSLNPYEDPDAREEVERIREKERIQREGQKFLDEARTGIGPLGEPPGAWGTDVEADLPAVEIDPALQFDSDPFPEVDL